jgi:hypothetical protein
MAISNGKGARRSYGGLVMPRRSLVCGNITARTRVKSSGSDEPISRPYLVEHESQLDTRRNDTHSVGWRTVHSRSSVFRRHPNLDHTFLQNRFDTVQNFLWRVTSEFSPSVFGLAIGALRMPRVQLWCHVCWRVIRKLCTVIILIIIQCRSRMSTEYAANTYLVETAR